MQGRPWANVLIACKVGISGSHAAVPCVCVACSFSMLTQHGASPVRAPVRPNPFPRRFMLSNIAPVLRLASNITV